jgi:hypothetical protein
MKKVEKFLIVLSLVGILALSALAQTPTGTIEGIVTDPQGAVVQGATVTITEVATGRKITTISNTEGAFSFRSLTPGVYTASIEKEGFSKATVENVTVQVGQIARVDVSLRVGSKEEVVQVDIGSTEIQVDTTRQTVDGVITSRQISVLPLNSRNFLDLASLQPSVTPVDGGNIDPTKENAYRAVRVNGGSGTSTRIQIEGIDVTDETVGTTTANFSTDAVQEFSLQRSSFDLSTSGLTSSGAISIATRYGGNNFSGSGFFFKQDKRFDARPDFVAQKPEFNRDQEGYRFQGPFIKNKLFFFSNFERFNQKDFSSYTSADFPSYNGVATVPIKARYALNRIDWTPTNSIKVFYLHNFNDDDSTSRSLGTVRSPFQNVDWTNTHIIGADFVTSKFTHSFRFGYVNFNNRIESKELSGFPFPKTPQGIPYLLEVGDLVVGPNTLAPQQTYQNNYQFKYDGSSTIFAKHILKYGADVNRIILGGFANFAGPLTVIGDFFTSTSSNPLDYQLLDATTGPNAGFFTPKPAHNLPFGGKYNTRYSFYINDQWKVLPNLTLNLGLRYNYETNYFANPDSPRLPQLDRFGPRLGDVAKFPKNAFSPQIGFAWDVFKDGKTSVRGGFFLAYEANIFNNSLFDEFARITTGIGPSVFSIGSGPILDPAGNPINIGPVPFPGCNPAAGDYSCLIGQPIRNVLGVLGQIHSAVQAAYSNISNYDPRRGPSEFANSNGLTFGGQIPGDYRIPYSIQFNIGFQRRIYKSNVISVDYIHQRGIGLPILLVDIENRRDARFFNEAAARSRVASRVCPGQSGCNASSVNPTFVQNYLSSNPSATIATFSLANDTVFPGRSSLTRARLLTGGFSLYRALQVYMVGRLEKESLGFFRFGDISLFKSLSYTIGYALGSNKSTGGGGRPEFIANVTNNIRFNDDFGPNALDRKHILTISASLETIGGFRIDQIYRFSTPRPLSLFVPQKLGANSIFTSDLNGDGGHASTPRVDLLPGTKIGDFGRKIKSIRDLNRVIAAFNAQYAGRLTPHGQRLVNAGIFSEAQMRALGAVIQPIPLVPESNPNPFNNLFTADYRISRPIKIYKENWILEPNFSVFNVFNNAPKGVYSGLDGTFGSLNYLYSTPSDRAQLDQVRDLLVKRRQLQFGIRFTF